MFVCSRVSFSAPISVEDVDEDWVPLAQPSRATSPRANCHYVKVEDDDVEPSTTMRNVRAWNKLETFHAAPTPANHPVAQDLAAVPNPFSIMLPPVARPQILAPMPPNQSRPIARPQILAPNPANPSGQCMCIRCGAFIPRKTLSVAMTGVKCDRCGCYYHYGCANLVRPPKNGSWACEGCLLSMR